MGKKISELKALDNLSKDGIMVVVQNGQNFKIDVGTLEECLIPKSELIPSFVDGEVSANLKFPKWLHPKIGELVINLTTQNNQTIEVVTMLSEASGNVFRFGRGKGNASFCFTDKMLNGIKKISFYVRRMGYDWDKSETITLDHKLTGFGLKVNSLTKSIGNDFSIDLVIPAKKYIEGAVEIKGFKSKADAEAFVHNDQNSSAVVEDLGHFKIRDLNATGNFAAQAYSSANGVDMSEIKYFSYSMRLIEVTTGRTQIVIAKEYYKV